MEKERNCGKTEPNIQEIGEMGWPKEKEYFIMPTEMFTLENFSRIELMVLENMFMQMANDTKDFGKMICKTVKEKKN